MLVDHHEASSSYSLSANIHKTTPNQQHHQPSIPRKQPPSHHLTLNRCSATTQGVAQKTIRLLGLWQLLVKFQLAAGSNALVGFLVILFSSPFGNDESHWLYVWQGVKPPTRLVVLALGGFVRNLPSSKRVYRGVSFPRKASG